MTWKDYTITTVSVALGLVIYELLRARLNVETVNLITEFICLLLIALTTILCGIGLRRKEWGQALACAALAGLYALMLRVTLSH